eukprot:jgi/Chlat1/3954/Chrsp26S04206
MKSFGGAVAAALTAPPPARVRFCVYDSRRGQREGEEAEKVLCFLPSEVPKQEQLAWVGLSQALVNFTSTFSPDAPCEIMQTEHHRHAYWECEPGIWMLLEVESNLQLDSHPHDDTLRSILRLGHRLFALFHGSIGQLLEKEAPDARHARRLLHLFFDDYVSELRDGLRQRGHIEVFAANQQLVQAAQDVVHSVYSGLGHGAVRYSMVLYKQFYLWSDVEMDDAAALYSYALHAVVPGAPGRMSGRQQQSRPASPKHAYSAASRRLAATSPLCPATWQQDEHGFLGSSCSYADVDGLIAVQFRGGAETCQLLAWQRDALTILLLLPSPPPLPASSVQSKLLELVSAQRNSHDSRWSGQIESAPDVVCVKLVLTQTGVQVLQLCASLAKELASIKDGHIPGYRYLYVDRMHLAVRASPDKKVATLSRDSLAVLNQVRDDLLASCKAGTLSEPCEVAVRSKQGAWVVARRSNEQELYVVMERIGDTLMEAHSAIECLSAGHFDGAFSTM